VGVFVTIICLNHSILNDSLNHKFDSLKYVV
jgi:hypothetical protein